jgi:hypothetical protein
LLSHYRHGQNLRDPGGWGSQNFYTFDRWRWWGFQLQAPAAFIPRRKTWLPFLLLAVSIAGHSAAGRPAECNIAMAASVIEIATLLFVRQCLNHMRHLVPPFNTRILAILHNNKKLNVNRTVFLLQTPKCKSVIGNIISNVSVHRHSGDILVSPDSFWAAVLCVTVVLKWNVGEMLQSAHVHNSDTLKGMYCDVCDVYWLRKE